MLSKLFKYEFKSTSRWMLPGYALLLLTSLINMFFVWKSGETFHNGTMTYNVAAQSGSIMFEIIEGVFIMSYFVLIVAVGLLTLWTAVSRFYKNLLSNEGYISMTMPVSVDQHLSVKLITSLVWTFITAAVVILSFLIMFMPLDIFEGIKYVLVNLELINAYNFSGQMYGILARISITGVLTVIQYYLTFYLAMALGQLSNNHKIGMAVVSYIGITFIMQIVMGIIMSTSMMSAIIFVENELEALRFVSGMFNTAMITSVVVSTAFYFGIRYILKNKINLQ